MIKKNSPFPVAFGGFRGYLLAQLLQLKCVRFHRAQFGCIEHPAEYERFLAEVVGFRIMETGYRRIGIFGTGEHTRVVLRAMPWLIERVRCFVDNNPRLHGQAFLNRPVSAPQEAVKDCEAFFLSTTVFQRAMHKDLRRLGFRGPVIAVDDEVPPHWFLLGERA